MREDSFFNWAAYLEDLEAEAIRLRAFARREPPPSGLAAAIELLRARVARVHGRYRRRTTVDSAPARG